MACTTSSRVVATTLKAWAAAGFGIRCATSIVVLRFADVTRQKNPAMKLTRPRCSLRLRSWTFAASAVLSFACAETSTHAPAAAPEMEPPTEVNAPSASNEGARTARVIGETVEYQVAGATFEGYVAYDASSTAKRPGILVVHEWWGQNDYARTRARQLAAEGYVAFAVDMYGQGKVTADPAVAKEWSTAVYSNPAVAEARFGAGLEVLKTHKFTSEADMSAVGYCFGGGISLNMARRGVDLDGVASFHGGLGTAQPAKAGEVKAKLLVLTGGADPMVPLDQVEGFRKEMREAGVVTEIHVYPGALHAFTNPAATEVGKKFDMPVAYDEAADAQSWNELMEFLTELYPRRQ